jgi:hypothetical protein
MKTTLNALALALVVTARLLSLQAQAGEFYSSGVGSQITLNNSEPRCPNSGFYSAVRRLQGAGLRGCARAGKVGAWLSSSTVTSTA